MSLTTPFVPPLAQPILKRSKLVNKARQLGCETFSGTVGVVVVKNWLKNVSDTLMVATRLIDKSAATWWHNLKLRSTTPIT